MTVYRLDGVGKVDFSDDRKLVTSGAYRVVYVVKIAEKVHVLHAFQKKTQQTSQKDIDLAKQRLKLI